jgi:hypothetical protein
MSTIIGPLLQPLIRDEPQWTETTYGNQLLPRQMRRKGPDDISSLLGQN